jgi:hypothetical protein
MPVEVDNIAVRKTKAPVRLSGACKAARGAPNRPRPRLVGIRKQRMQAATVVMRMHRCGKTCVVMSRDVSGPATISAKL